jgi:hypothetical protein
MKLETSLIALVCASVIALLPGPQAPVADAHGSPSGAFDYCPPESAPLGVLADDCSSCQNGFCRRGPDLAPRSTSVADAHGSPNVAATKVERSVVVKRSRQAAQPGRGPLRRLFGRIFGRR